MGVCCHYLINASKIYFIKVFFSILYMNIYNITLYLVIINFNLKYFFI